MCFAPQRRALFRHRNFQKRSEPLVFCTFWLRNVLRATTACTFSTSQLPKVVRDRQFLTLLTSKCASRHNGVQLFISHLASWLRTRRFSEPTFRPSGATNHWKNTVFRDFPTFSRICIFFLLTLSLLIFLFSLPLPCSAFHLSILSEVWLLNFLRSCLSELSWPTDCQEKPDKGRGRQADRQTFAPQLLNQERCLQPFLGGVGGWDKAEIATRRTCLKVMRSFFPVSMSSLHLSSDLLLLDSWRWQPCCFIDLRIWEHSFFPQTNLKWEGTPW